MLIWKHIWLFLTHVNELYSCFCHNMRHVVLLEHNEFVLYKTPVWQIIEWIKRLLLRQVYGVIRTT